LQVVFVAVRAAQRSIFERCQAALSVAVLDTMSTVPGSQTARHRTPSE